MAIALMLGYVDAVLHLGGPLLWPAVAFHVVIALLLPWALHGMQRAVPDEGEAGVDRPVRPVRETEK